MMKKITLLLALLISSIGFSQDLLMGFESGESGAIGDTFGGMAVPTVVTGTGTNTSQVLEIVGNSAEQVWQGTNVSLSTAVDLTTTHTMTIDVKSATAITFLVKVNTGATEAAAEVTHNGDGTWQTLSFTFDTALDGKAATTDGIYSNFVIHAYWTAGETGFGGVTTDERTFYVDNIKGPSGVVAPDPVPATGPTDPVARATEDYMSFYNGIASPSGDEYVNEAGVTVDGFGGDGGTSSVEDVVLADGNTVSKYKNHLFSGIGGGSYNVSSMEKLHIDVWSPGFTSFKVKLEANNGSNVEIEVPDAKVQNAWNSYDIDLSGYSTVDLTDLKFIVLVSYTGSGELLYVDNVYFWKTAVDPSTDATLQDLTVGGTTVTGFNPSTLTYDIELAEGTTVVPTVVGTPTQAAPATAVTTDATGLPGTTTVLVTAQDGSTTETYTLNFTVAVPGVSNYCNTEILHLDIPGETDSAINLTIVNTGANTMKVTASHPDIDVLLLQGAITDNPTVSAVDDTVSGEYSVTLTWEGTVPTGDVSIQHILWSKTTFGGNWQFNDATSPFDGTCATAGIEDLEKFNFSIYPNPANNFVQLRAAKAIDFVEVYDVMGRSVLKNTPNAKEKTLNVSTLSKGMYIVKVGIDGAVGTSKLLKK